MAEVLKELREEESDDSFEKVDEEEEPVKERECVTGAGKTVVEVVESHLSPAEERKEKELFQAARTQSMNQ